MRRIEYYKFEGFILKRHIPKISYQIRMHSNTPTVTCDKFFFPNIHVNRIRICFVKPHHSTTTAGIKYFLVGCHLSSFCAPDGTVYKHSLILPRISSSDT